jgi:phosphatidylglycerol---prolipoprotein diacylglyceryl transferase
MYPKCGPVPTYAIFYIAAIVAHLLILLYLARRMGLRRRLAWAIGMCYALGMTVGAKVLYDLLHDDFTWGGLISMRHYMGGGMWGGPLAYLAVAVPLVLAAGRDMAERRGALDSIALALPFPLILAKMGCFCNGCCWGKPCAWPWGLQFPAGGSAPAGMPLHPTQIYEILALATVWIVLSALNRPVWRGQLLAWFLALYGPGRALAEVWRGDQTERTLLAWVTASQVIVLAASAVAAGEIVLWRRQRVPREDSVAF